MRRGRRFAFCLVAVFPVLFITAMTGKAQEGRPKGRALLVGIDAYKNPDIPQTPGAEEDARDTRRLLIEKYSFLDSEIKILLREEATAQNIRDTFKGWLIQGTKPGDRVFFFYSGHGTRLKDIDGDEAERMKGDTEDEALAPYDALATPNSLIIDDELGVSINQLSGRMAVLVFDSCHSGTVSRGLRKDRVQSQQASAKYLPSPQEIQNLATRSGGKGGMDDYVVSPTQGAKGLSVVVDRHSIKAGGIVILSAAQPEQLAYSIPVRQDYYRGAFSFLLNQYLENPRTSLKDLKSSLASGMKDLVKELHLKGILKQSENQDPYFEVFSAMSLEDHPLFGASLTAPAVALTNPVSTISLSIRTLEGRTKYYFGTDKGKEYHETVSYEIETSKAGYLYLIVFSEGDVATRIFPNEYEQNNWVAAGKRKVFRDASAQEGFIVQEPEGKDIVIALVCSSKLNFGEADGYRKEQYRWKEVFDLLNSRRFSEYVGTLTRGQSAKGQSSSLSLDMTSWQSASIVVEATKVNR